MFFNFFSFKKKKAIAYVTATCFFLYEHCTGASSEDDSLEADVSDVSIEDCDIFLKRF